VLEAGRGIILTILAFGLMVFFHELGHFLAAKLMGVRVEVFAFGFGKKLFGRAWGNTEYKICAIPIGGYVKMAGGDEGEESKGAPDEFVSKTPGQRGVILLAGPVFSVLLGVPMALLMLVAGRDYPVSRVAVIQLGGPAWTAGIQHGDLITSIDGEPVETDEDVRLVTTTCPKDTPIPVTVDRRGETVTLSATIPEGKYLGIDCRLPTTTVRKVRAGSPAADAGIQPGDTITHVNGQRLHGWNDFRGHILPNADKSITLTLEGDSRTSPADGKRETRTVNATPTPEDMKRAGFTVHFPTTVGLIRPGTPAAQQLKGGDHITAVNGQAVATWQQVEDAVAASAPEVALTVERDGKTTDVSLQRSPSVRVTDSLGIAPELVLVVSAVDQPTTPALLPGDVIVKVKGKDTHTELRASLYTPKDDLLISLGTLSPVTVLRGEEEIEIAFEAMEYQVGLIGVETRPEAIYRKLGLFEAVGPAFKKTYSMFTLSVTLVGKLVSGAFPFDKLMGPVGIIQHTYTSARDGMAELFYLVHLITVSIGVFNLIPIPPLDGGRIVMVIYEKIRGKAPSRKFQEILILSGVGLVLIIFVTATFNDIRRMIGF